MKFGIFSTVTKADERSVQQFNTDPALRVCPACQSEHPRLELGDIAWPAVAQAIQGDMGKSEGE